MGELGRRGRQDVQVRGGGEREREGCCGKGREGLWFGGRRVEWLGRGAGRGQSQRVKVNHSSIYRI